MTQVASVEVGFKLAQDQLQQQIQQATRLLSSIPDIKLGGSGLSNELKQQQIDAAKLSATMVDLQGKILQAKSALAQDKGEKLLLSQQAALFQETLRHKQQLAAIQNAGISEADANNARALAQELNSLNVKRVQQEFIQASQASSGFFGKLNQFVEANQQASQFALGMATVSQQLSQFGAQLNGFNQKVFEAARAFDEARAKVATLSGESQKIAQDMRSLSAELDYQQSSTDLLNAQYEVLSSGFANASDASKVLKASALGAQGGFTDLKTQVDATTTVLNAYGLSAEYAQKVNDQLIATQNAGKLTLAQYAPLIGQVATQANAAGVSLESLNAFIATATAKGVKVESAVAGMRQAITSVLKPSAEAAEVSRQLGVEFNAQALKTKGLNGILAELDSKGAANVKTLTTLFGSVEAVTAILPSTGEGAKTFATNMEAIANSSGSAKKAADEVANSFDGQLKRATNQANEALISMGKGVAVALTPLLQTLNFLVENFNKLPEPVKGAVGVLLGLVAITVTLAGILTGIAAALPVLSAGFTVLTGSQIAATGGAVALTGAMAAQTVAAGGVATSSTVAAGAVAAQGAAAAAATGPVAAFGATLAAIAAPLAIVAAGVAAITFIRFTKDLKDGNEALDTLGDMAQNAGDSAFQLANRVKAANDRTQASRKEGVALTDEEVVSNQKLAKQGELKIQSLQEQLAVTKEFQPVGDEQKKTQDALIAQYEISIRAIEKQVKSLKENSSAAQETKKAVRDLITEQGELSAFYTNSNKDIENAAAKSRASKTAAIAAGTQKEKEAQADILASEKNALEEKVKLNEDAIAQLNSLKTEEKGKGKDADPSKIIAIDKQIRDLTGQGAAFEEQIAQNKIKTQQNGLEIQRRDYEINASKLKNIDTDRIAAVKRLELSRAVSTEEAERRIAANKIQSTQEQLAAEQGRLGQIQSLKAEGKITDEQAQKESLQIEEKVHGLKLQLVEAELAARKLVNDRALKDFELSNQKATVAIASAQAQAVRAIRARQIEGVTGEKDAALEVAKLQANNSQSILKQKEKELAGLRQLRSQGVLQEREFTQKELAATQEIENLRTQVIEQSLQVQQAARLRSIEVEAVAQKLALQQSLNQLEVQKGAFDGLIKRQENLKNLAQSRASLEKQIAATSTAAAQSSVDRISEAIEASKRLKDGGAELNPAVKRVLEFQQQSGLQGTGLNINSTELDVLKRKLVLEDELAQRKRDALVAEQNATTALLKIDLQRQQITAQQSLIEAQIAANRSDQGAAEASANVKTAQVGGNPEEIAAAAAQLQAAQLSQALSRQNVSLAQQGVATQGQLASDALNANAIKNQSDLGAFDDSERKRKIAAALALAEGGGSVNDVTGILQRAGGPISTASAGAQNLAQQAAAQGPNLGELIASGNNALVGRLDTMIQALKESLATPKQLTINGSKEPSTDAAKFFTNVNQAKAVGGNV